MSWHPQLVACKDTPVRRPPGRPSTRAVVKALILRMAAENPRWGHRRIQGELIKLGHRVAHSTVWEILHAAGIDPALRRSGPAWKQFLAAQSRAVIATDFLYVDTVLLKRIYVRVFIEHCTRRLRVAGITAHPDGAWTALQARNLAMALGERLWEMKLLLRDRGGQFTASFDAVFEDCGLRIRVRPDVWHRSPDRCAQPGGSRVRPRVDPLAC